MSGSVNKAILIGRLGKDPEIRTTNAGDKIASLSVATSDTWRDKMTGDRKEKTEWHRVTIFNSNLADVAEKYLRKGSNVYLEGKLRTRKYQAQDGTDRYTTEIVLENFGGNLTLLDSQRNGPPAAQSADDYGHTRTSNYDPYMSTPMHDEKGRSLPKQEFDLDDEIPF